MNSKEANKQKLIEAFERELPDFAAMIRATKDEAIIFHQDAFAADFQEEEYRLLGMAIKYAGLHNRVIHIAVTKPD